MAGKQYSISFGLDAGVSKTFTKSFQTAGNAVSTLADKVNQYNRRAAELKKVITKREDLEHLTRSYEKQRSELERYTEAVIRARSPSARLIELQERQEARVNRTQKSIEKQRESLKKLNEEMRTGGASTAFLKEQQKVYEARGAAANEALQREVAWEKRESALQTGALAALTYGAYKVADFAKGSIPVGASFDETLQNVSAMRPTSDEEKSAIREAALRDSQGTKFSPTQYLQGLNVYRSRGFGVDESITANKASAQLAMASGQDISQTSGALWMALLAFGEKADKAEHFADAFASAMQKSGLGAQTFFDAVESAGFEAAKAGVSFKNFNAMVGEVGLVGGNGGQTIANAIDIFTNPRGIQGEYLKLLGLKTTNAKGQMKPLEELLEEFGRLIEKHNLNENQTERLYRRVFGDEQASSMRALVHYAMNKPSQAEQESSVASIAAEANSDFNSSVAELKGAIERLQISVFDSFKGPLQALVEKMTELTNVLADFTKNHPKLTAAASGGAALATTAAGAALLKKLGSIFGKGGATGAATQAGQAATANPWGRVAAIIAALLASFVAYRATKFDMDDAKADVKALQEGTFEPEELASGGIVTKPTLAWVGEGNESEAVLPLSKLQSLLGPSGVTVHFAPVIHMNGSQDAYADVKRGLSEGQANLKAELERLLAHQRRLSFV